MDSGIYQIKNQVNGNRYIGSAVNLPHRWAVHLSALRHNTHHSPHLQAAFLKYGESAFRFAVLEQVEESSQLIAREQHYLDTLKPEYNIAPMAGSPMLGRSHTPKARAKMSRANSGEAHPQYGKHRSEQTRSKISEAWTPERRQALRRASALRGGFCKGMRSLFYGKHHTEEAKRKIRQARKGKRPSEATRRKMSDSQKARWRRVHGLIDAAV